MSTFLFFAYGSMGLVAGFMRGLNRDTCSGNTLRIWALDRQGKFSFASIL